MKFWAVGPAIISFLWNLHNITRNQDHLRLLRNFFWAPLADADHGKIISPCHYRRSNALHLSLEIGIAFCLNEKHGVVICFRHGTKINSIACPWYALTNIALCLVGELQNIVRVIIVFDPAFWRVTLNHFIIPFVHVAIRFSPAPLSISCDLVCAISIFCASQCRPPSTSCSLLYVISIVGVSWYRKNAICTVHVSQFRNILLFCGAHVHNRVPEIVQFGFLSCKDRLWLSRRFDLFATVKPERQQEHRTQETNHNRYPNSDWIRRHWRWIVRGRVKTTTYTGKANSLDSFWTKTCTAKCGSGTTDVYPMKSISDVLEVQNRILRISAIALNCKAYASTHTSKI